MVHVLAGVFCRTLNKECRMLNAKRWMNMTINSQEKAHVYFLWLSAFYICKAHLSYRSYNVLKEMNWAFNGPCDQKTCYRLDPNPPAVFEETVSLLFVHQVFLNCFLILINQLCLPKQRYLILNAILCLTLAQDLEMISSTIHMETISFTDTSHNNYYYFNVRQ